MINVGPELDAIIAEEVMGEKKPTFTADAQIVLDRQLSGEAHIESPLGCWYLVCIYEHGDVPEWIPMPYSTYLESAMDILIKDNSRLVWSWRFSSRGSFYFRLGYGSIYDNGRLVKANQWWLEYNTPGCDKTGPYADTAALAICLAALQSLSKDLSENF
jgi:hypothetical protein